MDVTQFSEYLTAGKGVLDLMKTAIGLLPKSEDREAISAQIARAEAALKIQEAALAQSLGYHICQCTWPPQIMLYQAHQRRYVCQNSACGFVIREPSVEDFHGGRGEWAP
jgi:hypothetical protein